MTAQPATESLAVLHRAASDHALVTVELRSGERFDDGVCEVFSECGADLVVFHAHNCVFVADIARCSPVTMHGEDAVA